MKQILFVLAILITGIASAQQWGTISLCEDEIRVVATNIRYQADQPLLDQMSSGNGLQAGGERAAGRLLCLDDAIGVNDRFGRYFVQYRGMTHTGRMDSNGDRWDLYELGENSIQIRVFGDNYGTPDNNRRSRFVVTHDADGDNVTSRVYHTSAHSAWSRANE